MTICVLMCGGKGSRINAYSKISEKITEKPLIILNNKPLIEHIVETLRSSKKGFSIFAAVSSNTKETEVFIKYKYYKIVTILKTMGNEYSEDFTSIVNLFLTKSRIREPAIQYPQNNLFLRNQKQIKDYSKIIFLPIDIPLISARTIERIAELKHKTALISIVIDKNIIIENNFLPTSYTVNIDKKDYCYTGISVLELAFFKNQNKSLSGNQIEEEAIILNDPELAYNINTIEDLKRTEEFFLKNKNRNN
ncbi:MAG TPA: NTP transferase domain-containing protein [Candidatus Nitrosocosmicus sp.]|nr:NTP transferase domain-containing protein [Candidatus Nitrosocosmicus sp.]